jgi:acetyltransferase EpsM
VKVVIIGGRGNGTVIASTIEDCRKAGQDIECEGFLNDNETTINGYPVLGGIRNGDWKKLGDDCFFVYAMSNVNQSHERHRLLRELEISIERFATIVHPTALVSDKASLGRGVVLMPYVHVGPDVFIGDHSQFYAQSFVGHDTTVNEFVFVANNASLGGRVLVKDGAHIGSNASIVERVTISEYSLVGLGSVVLRDVAPFEKVAGNPARTIGSLRP